MIEYLNISLIYAIGKASLPLRLAIFALLTPEDFYVYGLCVFAISLSSVVIDPGLSSFRLSKTESPDDAAARVLSYFLSMFCCSSMLLAYTVGWLNLSFDFVAAAILIVITNTLVGDIKTLMQQSRRVKRFVVSEQLGTFVILLIAYTTFRVENKELLLLFLLLAPVSPIVNSSVIFTNPFQLRGLGRKLPTVYNFCRGIVVNKLLLALRKHIDKWTVPFFFMSHAVGQIFFVIMIVETIRQQLNNLFAIRFESIYRDTSNDDVKNEFKKILFILQAFVSLLTIAILGFSRALAHQAPEFFDNWLESLPLVELFCVSIVSYSLTGPFGNFLQISNQHKILNFNQLVFGVVIPLLLTIPGLFGSNIHWYLLGLLGAQFVQRIHLLLKMRYLFSFSNRECFDIAIVPFVLVVFWFWFNVLNIKIDQALIVSGLFVLLLVAHFYYRLKKSM